MKWLPVMLAGIAAALPPSGAGAADAALVVGVGTTSFEEETAADDAGLEHPSWRRVQTRAARDDAERAFRELVRAAAVGPLYTAGPLWYDDDPGNFSPAVLLTDGTTDNRAVPSLPVLRTMSVRAFEELGPDDDAVAFLAGLGEGNGRDLWIRGRQGRTFALSGLMDRLFSGAGSGTRVLVARLYPENGEGGASTLLVTDPRSAEALRTWSANALEQARSGSPVPPPGRLLPGQAGSLAAASPPRLMRIRDVLAGSGEASSGAVVFNLEDQLDSRRQVVEADVSLREETSYETNVVRRAGPLFTIVEEEVIRPVGIVTTIDPDLLVRELTSRDITTPAARSLTGAVRSGASASFASTNRVGLTDYELAFDRDQRRVVIVYYD